MGDIQRLVANDDLASHDALCNQPDLTFGHASPICLGPMWQPLGRTRGCSRPCSGSCASNRPQDELAVTLEIDAAADVPAQ